MANSLTAASPTYWSRAAGRKFYATTIFRSITDFSEESVVGADGRIADRPYRSNVIAENYIKGTALTAQDLTYTSDTLTIDQFYSFLMYVDDIDKLQNKYDTVRLWSEEAGRRIGVRFDARVLYEVVNATTTVDAANLGGTSGEGIALTSANMAQLFGEVNEALDTLDIPEEERYIVISPLAYNKLWQFIGGKESMLGDKTGETGMIGNYGGLKIYKSNNTTCEARWTPADNPSDEATITIEGITFTFQSVIGSVAGNILQTTSLAVTIGNLVALINAGGVGDGTNYVSLSTANQRTVQNWVAVDGTTYFLVRIKGGGNDITVASSESADTWDAKWETQDLFAGRKDAISAAIQIGKQGIVDTAMASTVSAGKRGTNVMPLLAGGVKTFNAGKDELVWIKVRTDS